MATLYKTDGTSEEVKPKNGRNFQLKELYEMLGCDMIEVAYPRGDTKHILIIDEEGKVRNAEPKPLNREATVLYNNQPDWISGPALYCLKGELD